MIRVYIGIVKKDIIEIEVFVKFFYYEFFGLFFSIDLVFIIFLEINNVWCLI